MLFDKGVVLLAPTLVDLTWTGLTLRCECLCIRWSCPCACCFQLRTLEYRLDKKWCPSLRLDLPNDPFDMHHLVYGNELKTQVAYLFADIVTACGILTCDVVARTDCAKSLSIVFVSLRLLAS